LSKELVKKEDVEAAEHESRPASMDPDIQVTDAVIEQAAYQNADSTSKAQARTSTPSPENTKVESLAEPPPVPAADRQGETQDHLAPPQADPTASTGTRSGGLGRTPSGRLARKGSAKPAVGKPFPSRPLGCKLSAAAWEKVEALFNAMDADRSNAVTREQALAFFKGAFAQLSVDAMFNEVDVDGSGAITAEEFIDFWVQVRKAGYSDDDIIEELEQLREGNAWVDWKDDRATSSAASKMKRFPKRPLFSKLSTKTWKKCEALFRKMDTEGKMTISPENAEAFFKGAFSKVSAKAMFNEVDTDNHGMITADQWMAFWVQVKGSGYKDKDIQSELDQLLEGGAWVDWKDGRSTAR